MDNVQHWFALNVCIRFGIVAVNSNQCRGVVCRPVDDESRICFQFAVRFNLNDSAVSIAAR